MTLRYVGFNPPFVGGTQSIMSSQSDDRLIANDVLQNLMILPNEIPFRDNFGVNLRNFTFEKLDENNLRSLEEEITTQIRRNDERLIIKLVELIPDSDEATLTINIIVALREDPDRNITIKRLIRTLLNNG